MRLNLRIGHDASASISDGGKVLCAIAEERMSRIKMIHNFVNAVVRCLDFIDLHLDDVKELAISSRYYPKYLLNYIDVPAELVEPLHEYAMRDFSSLAKIKNKIIKSTELKWFKKELAFNKQLKLPNLQSIIFADHHLCHASAVIASSPFVGEAGHGVLVVDGIGDGTSISVWRETKSGLTCLKRWNGMFSLGWFYGIATEAFGWEHGTDEWKLMGLAAYGMKGDNYQGLEEFCPKPSLNDERSFGVHFPDFTIYNDNGRNVYLNPLAQSIRDLKPHDDENQYAHTVQTLVENSFKNLIEEIKTEFEFKFLSLCGGFFLNVKNNQKLHEMKLFKGIHVSPDSGDSGLIHGCAILQKNEKAAIERLTDTSNFYSQISPLSPYLGPKYTNNEIENELKDRKLVYQFVEDVPLRAAQLLHEDKILGWFQGRMEAGARALGNRSILSNPTNPSNKDRVNKAIKYREGFRPFCPSMLEDDAENFLENYYINRDMTCSFAATKVASEQIPAVVHIDGTCRAQIVDKNLNATYHKLLCDFKALSGVGVVLNTSFNIKGEPIVENLARR